MVLKVLILGYDQLGQTALINNLMMFVGSGYDCIPDSKIWWNVVKLKLKMFHWN